LESEQSEVFQLDMVALKIKMCRVNTISDYASAFACHLPRNMATKC